MNNTAIVQLFSNVINCERCSLLTASKLVRDKSENVPQPGFIGKNYEKKRVLLIGRNPGACPPSMKTRDLVYMQALLNLGSQQTVHTYDTLYYTLLNYMPDWRICRDYFQLDECGLYLEDIAFFNVVRCRTDKNETPSKSLTQNCMNEYLVSFIDIIEPKVIVCIGKWAFDQLNPLIGDRNINTTYINGDRSLNSDERKYNRKAVVDIVREKIRTNE